MCCRYNQYVGDSSIDIQQVEIVSDILTSGCGKPTKIMIKLHQSISASGLQDQPGHPNACSVIALLFADKLLNAPQKTLLGVSYERYYLSDEAFEMVLSSIREGLEIYGANFSI